MKEIRWEPIRAELHAFCFLGCAPFWRAQHKFQFPFHLQTQPNSPKHEIRLGRRPRTGSLLFSLKDRGMHDANHQRLQHLVFMIKESDAKLCRNVFFSFLSKGLREEAIPQQVKRVRVSYAFTPLKDHKYYKNSPSKQPRLLYRRFKKQSISASFILQWK